MRPDESALTTNRAPTFLRRSIRQAAAALGVPAAHAEEVARQMAEQAARERFGPDPASVLAAEIERRRRVASDAALAGLLPASGSAVVVEIDRPRRERR